MNFFISTFLNLILFYLLATGFAFMLLTINKGLRVVQQRTPFYKDYIREIKNSILVCFYLL
jgi:hypothetical protein